MIALLDHDDSFVHTLANYLECLSAFPLVIPARTATLEAVLALAPAGIILSPGPGAPHEWPASIDLVRRAPADLPFLGVCLGHQCIGAAFGAVVERAPMPRHGMTSPIRHDGRGTLQGLADPFVAARYHSLAVSRDGMPPELVVSAEADDGVVMGIRHRFRPVEGVQFHPESVLTPDGLALVANFVQATIR